MALIKRTRFLLMKNNTPTAILEQAENKSSINDIYEDELPKCTQQSPNAIKLNIKNKLPDEVKENLKSLFGCHWNDNEGSYTCPIESEIYIEAHLERNQIHRDLQPIYDHYFQLSPNEQKAEKFDQAKRYTIERGLNVINHLKQLLIDFNKHCNKNIQLKDVLEATKEIISNLIEPDNPKQLTHLNFIYDYAQEFKELHSNELELQKKSNDLRDEDNEKSKILEKLQKNEIGDAELFVERYKNKYIYDPTEGKNGAFYLWNGSHWELDLLKERYKDFDTIAHIYLNLNKNDTLEEKINEELRKRSTQIRSDRRRRNVLETVSAMLSSKIKWDNIPKLLPCKNGLIDLVTGELLEAKQEYYIRKLCPVDFNLEAECPKFLEFLNDISLEDNEWIEFLQRSIGYAILGNPKEEVIFYWYGKGRNGKGTLAKVLHDVLGQLARTFPSEMLLLQKNPPSSSSPSPELANLEGVRLAFFSEINKTRNIDSAKVKNLSGRDKISCRRLFSNIQLEIEPTHTMIIQTNNKPKAPADDNALWARNVLIPFKASFVRDPKELNERPLKENLKDDLLEEREGILRWILEGCQKYQKNGLQIPQSIHDETESYRKQNDGIACFLEERCSLIAEFSTPKQKLREEIQKYCEENDHTPRPSKNEITAYLKDKFNESRNGKCESWVGIKINEVK